MDSKQIGGPKYGNTPQLPLSKKDKGGRVQLIPSKFRKLIIDVLGYNKYLNRGSGMNLTRTQNNVVEFVEEHFLIADVLEYLQFYEMKDEIEIFLKSASFLSNIVKTLPELKVNFLRGSLETAYFPYRNGIKVLTKEAEQFIPLSQAPGVIWKQEIIRRDYIERKEKSVFETFLLNICGQDPKKLFALRTIIGYLLHDFKNPARAFAVILLDANISYFGTANGGTGKSLLFAAIGKMVSMLEIPGRRFDGVNKFVFQQVEEWFKIVYLDDARENLDFSSLYTAITSIMTVEKKNKQPFVIPFDLSPKICISSNFLIGEGGNSDRRRMIEFEFSDYYNLKHTPEDDFGHRFFDDWDAKEWARFDYFMLGCVKLFLRRGLVRSKTVNLENNRLVRDTCTEFVEWADAYLKEGKQYDKQKLFDHFVAKHPIKQAGLSSIMFKKWIDSWAYVRKIRLHHFKSNGKALVSLLPQSSDHGGSSSDTSQGESK